MCKDNANRAENIQVYLKMFDRDAAYLIKR